MKTYIDSVLEEFNKKFSTLTTFEGYGAVPGGFERDCKTEVKEYITKALDQQKEEMIKWLIDIVEGQGRYHRNGFTITSDHQSGEWIHRGDLLHHLKEHII